MLLLLLLLCIALAILAMSVEVRQLGSQRKRAEESWGTRTSWKANLSERWSLRKFAVVRDAERWLSGGPKAQATANLKAGSKAQSKASSSACSKAKGQGMFSFPPSLAALLGQREMSRPDAVERFLSVCTSRRMVNPEDNGEIVFPMRLAKLFGQRAVRKSGIPRLLERLCSGDPQDEQPNLAEVLVSDRPAGHSNPSSAPAPAQRSQERRRANRNTAAIASEQSESQRDKGIELSKEDPSTIEEDAALLDMSGDDDLALLSSGGGGASSSSSAPWRRWSELRPCEHNLVAFQLPLTSGAPTPPLDIAPPRKKARVSAKANSVAAEAAPSARMLAAAAGAVPLEQEVVVKAVRQEGSSSSDPSYRPCEALAEDTSSASIWHLEECAGRLVPQLSQVTRTSAAITFRCRPNEAKLHFEIVAEPMAEGSLAKVAHRARKAAWWREPCCVRTRPAAGGELVAFGEVQIVGLEPEFAYRVFVEVRPRKSAADVARSAEALVPQRVQPEQWGPREVVEWCVSVAQVPELAKKAEEYAIDGGTLLGLGEEDIRALGVTAPFLVRRVLRAIRALCDAGPRGPSQA